LQWGFGASRSPIVPDLRMNHRIEQHLKLIVFGLGVGKGHKNGNGMPQYYPRLVLLKTRCSKADVVFEWHLTSLGRSQNENNFRGRRHGPKINPFVVYGNVNYGWTGWMPVVTESLDVTECLLVPLLCGATWFLTLCQELLGIVHSQSSWLNVSQRRGHTETEPLRPVPAIGAAAGNRTRNP